MSVRIGRSSTNAREKRRVYAVKAAQRSAIGPSGIKSAVTNRSKRRRISQSSHVRAPRCVARTGDIENRTPREDTGCGLRGVRSVQILPEHFASCGLAHELHVQVHMEVMFEGIAKFTGFIHVLGSVHLHFPGVQSCL